MTNQVMPGMKPGPGFILFGGTNDRALLALCRGFEEQKIPFGLVGGTNVIF